MSAEEVVRGVYGSRDGDWLIVESPVGIITPPIITVGNQKRLHWLGSTSDVVMKLYVNLCASHVPDPRSGRRRRDGALPAQEALAKLLGVKQQSVSRYVRGYEPQLTGEGWRSAVRAWHNPASAARVLEEVLARLALSTD